MGVWLVCVCSVYMYSMCMFVVCGVVVVCVRCVWVVCGGVWGGCVCVKARGQLWCFLLLLATSFFETGP